MKQTSKIYFKNGIKCVAMLCCTLLLFGGIMLTAHKQQGTVSAYASEESSVTDFVSRLYTVILERTPDEAGLAEWTGYLEDGVFTGAEVAKGFIMSDEFLGKEMENEEFVQILYQAFFGREADPDGLATWVDFLDEGYRKSYIFAGFANSGEFGALCDGYGVAAGSVPVTVSEQQPNLSDEEYNIWLFVERMYTEVLDRTPDMGGLKEWADYLQAGTYSGAEVASGFILSNEFQAKEMTNEEYVQIMYSAFFGREADPSGLETWVNALKTEFTKEYVFAGFANSAEFGTLCESYGITQGSVVVPDPAPNVKAEIANEIGGVHLCWNAAEGVEQYGIWRSVDSENGTYEWLGNTEETSFTDTTVISGTTYYYKLTFYDTTEETHSDKSKAVGIIYVDTPEVTDIYNGAEGITLEWNAVEGAQGYAVYCLYDDFWGKVATVEGAETLTWTYYLNDANEGNSFTFTVRALAGSDLKTLSGQRDGGRTMMWLESLLDSEIVLLPNIDMDRVNFMWNISDAVDGYEIRILQDSVEYGIYKGSYGGSESGDRWGHWDIKRPMFENLSGILTMQVRSYKILDGGGIIYSAWSEEKKVVMLAEVEAMINKLVEDILASSETELEKAIAIYDWIIDNVDYRRGMFYESGYFENAILNGYAMCSGYADSFRVLAERVGLEVNCVSGYPEEGDGHEWNQVKIDGQWYNLDATWGQGLLPNPEDDEFEKYILRFGQFLLSDESFTDHGRYSVNRTEEYECPEDYDIFSYVVQRDRGNASFFASTKEELKNKLEQKFQEGHRILEIWYKEYDLSKVVEMLTEKCEELQYHIFVSKARTFSSYHLCKVEIIMSDCEEGSEGTQVIIPDGVSSIADNAFEDFSDLTSIIIPDSVTTIGAFAFSGCSSLTEINIPDSVITIGEFAFSGCSSLTEINIPDSVAIMGEFAFRDCSSLTEINIPEGVTTIGESTFKGCSSLVKINIPDSVTELGDNAFYGCRSLSEISIPEGVTTIGESAFERCTRLSKVNIPEGVTTIGESAFQQCGSLTEIDIPDSVTTIEKNAFSGCESLVKVVMPKGLTRVEDGLFSVCGSLTNIELPEGVTYIGANAFYSCSKLTTINIPDGVIEIGVCAFSECEGLTAIKIPDSVINIGWGAFCDCRSLAEINIPDGVTTIGGRTFENCSKLTCIEIPESVVTIDYNAFFFSGLTSIKISEYVTYIGKLAFEYCGRDFIIYCPSGSYAESYAIENDIAYVTE